MSGFNRFILGLFLLQLTPQILYSQYDKVEQITFFSSGSKNPVKIEVETGGGRYIFKALNSSYYPYLIELEFKYLQNLMPYKTKETFIVYPGPNRLFDLYVKDPSLPHDYSYSYRFSLGDPKKVPIQDFPYILPLGVNKKAEIEIVKLSDSKFLLTNFFKVKTNDSIHCIRKGYVTSVGKPDMSSIVISENSSLEILHLDGTIAVYSGLNPSTISLRPGQMVYPGQFIGLADSNERIAVSVFSLQRDGFLRSAGIKYYTGDSNNLKTIAEIDGLVVKYSEFIVEIELTKREKRLKAKGKLY